MTFYPSHFLSHKYVALPHISICLSIIIRLMLMLLLIYLRKSSVLIMRSFDFLLSLLSVFKYYFVQMLGAMLRFFHYFPNREMKKFVVLTLLTVVEYSTLFRHTLFLYLIFFTFFEIPDFLSRKCLIRFYLE